MESLNLLNLNMLINKMQKIDKQSLKSPLPKSLPGALRIPPGCASLEFEILKIVLGFIAKTLVGAPPELPGADPNFDTEAFSLHRGWSRANCISMMSALRC